MAVVRGYLRQSNALHEEVDVVSLGDPDDVERGALLAIRSTTALSSKSS
jgi:hypothetical protein